MTTCATWWESDPARSGRAAAPRTGAVPARPGHQGEDP